MLRLLLGLAAAFALPFAFPWGFAADPPGEAIRVEVKVLPGLQRHVDLLGQPGYVAIVLENNGLGPSQSSKLKVGEQGRAAEIRGATLRFTARKEQVFSYEASYALGVGDARISFPVAVDVSGVPAGKVTITLSPPLARLIPAELVDRIRFKTQIVANATAQQKVLEYLDLHSKSPNFIETILVDAYNRSGGPLAQGGRDVGDAIPLSDQWLLIVTLVIWLVIIPAFLFLYRLRRGRAKPA